MDDLNALVGGRVRAARAERGWSLGALAAAAGVGKGSLSEIENGTRNPTLSTLYAVADALGTPLAALLDGRAGARLSSPGISAALLDVRHGATTVEVYRLALHPGATHRSGGHPPGVVEHLLVTDGRASVGRAGEETVLAAGQSTSWVSDVPHTYTALDGSPADAVLVIRSPQGVVEHL